MRCSESPGRKWPIIIIGLLLALMFVAIIIPGCISIRVQDPCEVETHVDMGALSIHACRPQAKEE
jgi:hypothetical protein